MSKPCRKDRRDRNVEAMPGPAARRARVAAARKRTRLVTSSDSFSIGAEAYESRERLRQASDSPHDVQKDPGATTAGAST